MKLSVERFKKIFVPNDEDGAFVEIKCLNLDTIANIEEESSNLGYSNDDSTFNYKPIQRDNLIAEKCMTNWYGFSDENGKTIEFSRGNVKTVAKFAIDVLDKRVRFLSWVAGEHDKFYKEVEKEEKEAIKN